MKPREIRLSTTPTDEDIAQLRLGDIVYLDGLMYTAREGVYMRALEKQANIPMELPADSAANFHCSPAAVIREDGSFDMGAVTATASFRFAKWLPEWIAKTGAKLIIGKGGMSSKDYKEYFVPNGAVYLSTVGYGTGALLGRGGRECRSRSLARGAGSCTGHVGHQMQQDGTIHRRLGHGGQLPVRARERPHRREPLAGL